MELKKEDNEFMAIEKVCLKELIKWRLERLLKRKDLSYKVPRVEQVEIDFILNNQTQVSLTFIGHCTFLIQMSELNMITDPVWATRMGLEKRLVQPGIPLHAMPKIDVVLISHNHYDHLDFPSIRKLKGDPIHLVPQGLGKSFMKKGFKNVKEFTWWDSMYHKDVKITFVPSKHWSRRTLWDMNRTLWGGWMVEGCEKTVYFVGDSGYHSGFKTIGKRFDIDYVLMPIGAYDPEWFMKNQHVTPEEAVQCFCELNAKHFIPMHYDAFRLANDTPKEAIDRLEMEWDKLSLEMERLKFLKLGETEWSSDSFD